MMPISMPAAFAHAPRQLSAMMGRFLRFDEVESLWMEATRSEASGPSLARRILDELHIDVTFNDEELARIPSLGPAILVCNHPTGILEGLILMSLLPQVRSDFKFIANKALSAAQQFERHLLHVDVSGTSLAKQSNAQSLAAAVQLLRSGGLLVVFPAGAVSTWDWAQGQPVDPTWSHAATRLALLSGANTVPVHFSGSTTALFQIAGAIHPSLRTARLPAELLEKRGHRMDVRLGHLVSVRQLQALDSIESQTNFLRAKTYLLALKKPLPANVQMPLPIAGPQVSERELRDEVGLLPGSQKLVSQGALTAYIARARQIPAILTEIGRLREQTFRLSGEGTGLSKDLDTFDAGYEHIFIWNSTKCHVVGSYRMCRTEAIVPRNGVAGLYTHSLFKYPPKLFDKTGPAIELGRSFVRQEYQKEYAPLLLLWKGVCTYVAQNPQNAVLFGAVSISRDYTEGARALMVEWLNQHCSSPQLSRLVEARNPYKSKTNRTEIRRFVQAVDSVEGLAEAVAEIDSKGKGVPVLLRQYIKLGGVSLGYNIDPRFSDVLDCLFMVDLRSADPMSVRRYMGEQGYQEFKRFHGMDENKLTE